MSVSVYIVDISDLSPENRSAVVEFIDGWAFMKEIAYDVPTSYMSVLKDGHRVGPSIAVIVFWDSADDFRTFFQKHAPAECPIEDITGCDLMPLHERRVVFDPYQEG